MKSTRLFLSLWLAAAIMACSILPDFPALPPGRTPTPSITSTPEATFTPTLTPTPLPIARVVKGDHALFNGDFDDALIQYKIAFQDSPDPSVRASAKWGEARVQFSDDRYEETLAAIQTLFNEYPESIFIGQAYFLQGLTHYRLNNYQAAADAWKTYLTLRPGVLDAYVQELRGDALYEEKNYPEAIAAYRSAIQAPALGDDITLDLKVADTTTKLGDYASAQALYDGITARAPNDYVKAQAAYESGLAYQASGQSDEALAKFRLVVENYPRSIYAYTSLVALLDAGGEINDLDRGLTDYFNGHYDVAVAAFDRYMAANPTHDGTALYYRALANVGLGIYDAALQDYSTFIANYPAHPKWAVAWGNKADIELDNLGSNTVAAKTLLDFVEANPGSEFSANYLMKAALIYELDGNYPEALQVWARVSTEYPGSEQASRAIFLSGIINYRNGDAASALNSFNSSLSISTLPQDRARADLWIGKTQQKLGDGQSAINAWREAQNLDPSGYYSERARDLLSERAPFAAPVSTNLTPNLEIERKDADSWVRLTFNLPPETDLNGLGALAADPRVIRGTELWDLGIYAKSKLEFEDLRLELETKKDAEGSYRLINYLLDLGLYFPAIFAARQTIAMAGLVGDTESMLAPLYFSHVRFGLYYSDLVIPEAQTNGFDPLFIFSVIRQESYFEGFINSSAGAGGLLQIMPSTGAEMVTQLGWPINFDNKDLYRPDVSVTLGTHYLGNNRDLVDGDLYATLAAYNGGPGYALQWKELSGNDPDLFLETVRFPQTRDYIRSIYEFYIIYRRLYGIGEQ